MRSRGANLTSKMSAFHISTWISATVLAEELLLWIERANLSWLSFLDPAETPYQVLRQIVAQSGARPLRLRP